VPGLLDDISKAKMLSANASAIGVAFTLCRRAKDIETTGLSITPFWDPARPGNRQAMLRPKDF